MGLLAKTQITNAIPVTYYSDCESTDGKIDVEAPSPGSMISKLNEWLSVKPPPQIPRTITYSSTHQWSSNTCNTIHGSNETSIHRSFPQWHRMCKNDQSTREDTSTSQTSNCTPNNESLRSRRNTTNQRSKFKYSDGGQKYPFQAEECIYFPINQLKRTDLIVPLVE